MQKLISKFSGIQVLQNSFTVKDGALEKANNVIISQDFLLSKRRGYNKGYQLPASSLGKHLFEYGNSIFVITQDKLFRLLLTAQTGQAVSASGDKTITITQNSHGLLSDYYISELNVTNTDDFNNAFPNRQADFYGIRKITKTGANTFTVEADNEAIATKTSGATACSYKVYKEVTGQSVAAANVTPQSLIASKNTYFTTDNGVLKLEREDLPVIKAGIEKGLDVQVILTVDESGYYTGGIQANSQTAYAVCFGRRDANDNLNLGTPSQSSSVINSLLLPTVSFISGTDIEITYSGHGLQNGDIIYVYDFVGTGTIPDGTPFAVSGVSGTHFHIDPTTQGLTITGATGLKYGIDRSAKLYIGIPSGIVLSETFIQIYRATPSVDANTTPDQTFKLVAEELLTASNVINGTYTYYDTIPQILIDSQEELYTNPTREGILQGNDKPPFCKDIALFRGYTFYANCLQYRYWETNLIAPNVLQNNDTLVLAGSTYKFIVSANNAAVGNEVTTSSVTVAAGTATVTQNNHGFAANDVINIISSTLTSPETGLKTIVSVAANSFTYATTATGTAEITYEGLKDSTNKFLVKVYQFTSPAVTTTLSQAISNTSRYLIKAVNRNTSGTIYGEYISAIDDTPGKMRFVSKSLNATSFSATMAARGDAFNPTIPSVANSDSTSKVDSQPNNLWVSKYNEPEAVPLGNSLATDTSGLQIYRIAALRDSLIILKENGVFRLNGTNPSNFIITALDTTVKLIATRSVAVLNNSVYALTNQGIVQITDSSVRIISRPIEPLLTAVSGSAYLEAATSAVAYESERIYILATLQANTTSSIADICYVYNYLTDNITSIDGTNVLFYTGFLSKLKNSMYFSLQQSRDLITYERNSQSKTDYSDNSFRIPVYNGRLFVAETVAGSNQVKVTLYDDHGYKAGDVITLFDGDVNLLSQFSFPYRIEGARVVGTIIDTVSFYVTADEAATANTVGSIVIANGISELSWTASTSNGTNTVSCTGAHSFSNGQAVNINFGDNTLHGAFSTGINAIKGFRTISVIDVNNFTFVASENAGSSVTGSVNISDRKQDYKNVLLVIPSGTITPQAGDALVVNNSLVKIKSINKYSSTYFNAVLFSDYLDNSIQQSFLHELITSTLKFSPISDENVSTMKAWSEFQASFRSGGSCSMATVNFSTDTSNSSKNNDWQFNIGSDGQGIFFGTWGAIEWGQQPWGGNDSVLREYYTRPAVTLRCYVNFDASIGNYIQPIITHKVACETLDLQSISINMKPISTRNSR